MAGLLIERSGIGGGLVAVITLTVLGVAWSMLGVGSGSGRARRRRWGAKVPDKVLNPLAPCRIGRRCPIQWTRASNYPSGSDQARRIVSRFFGAHVRTLNFSRKLCPSSLHL